MSLLHRQVGGELRATAISINSMMAQAAGALGVLTLTAVADQESARVAMYIGGVVLAVAAPLYIPAWRQERARRTDERRQTAEPTGVGQ
jgi:predicted MFS family arabinose efflux permease